MSTFAIIDLLARGGALALLALWSWLLFRDKWHAAAARLAVAMNIAICCHVLITIFQAQYIFAVDVVLTSGAGLVAVLFWLFTKAWFDDREKIGAIGWAAVGCSTLLIISLQFPALFSGTVYGFLIGLFRTLLAFFALAGLVIAWRGRDNDLVESRRRFRIALVVAVGAFIMLTNVIEIAAFSGYIDDHWRSFIEFGILMLAFGFCAAMFGITEAELLGAPEREAAPAVTVLPDGDPLAATIETAMSEERLYRDERLTIAALASTLGEQEYRIRRTINGTLGHRNFARFVNSYRLDEVKAALADQSQREVPILTIALDAGFGSLGPFNRAFRDAEGMTPTEYRKTKLADSEIG